MAATPLTIVDIENLIDTEKTQFFSDGYKMTICILTLKNGFKLTGESATVNPNNFNKELGEKYAKENAMQKIWQLEGYLRYSDAQQYAMSNGVVSENYFKKLE